MRPQETIAQVFKSLSQPARVDILLVIGSGEACVCHLEAYLGLRQTTISQHLMALREAGMVETQRNGRNIYYRVVNPALMDLLEQAMVLGGQDPVAVKQRLAVPAVPCPCPHCNPEACADLDCSDIRVIP